MSTLNPIIGSKNKPRTQIGPGHRFWTESSRGIIRKSGVRSGAGHGVHPERQSVHPGYMWAASYIPTTEKRRGAGMRSRWIRIQRQWRNEGGIHGRRRGLTYSTSRVEVRISGELDRIQLHFSELILSYDRCFRRKFGVVLSSQSPFFDPNAKRCLRSLIKVAIFWGLTIVSTVVDYSRALDSWWAGKLFVVLLS